MAFDNLFGWKVALTTFISYYDNHLNPWQRGTSYDGVAFVDTAGIENLKREGMGTGRSPSTVDRQGPETGALPQRSNIPSSVTKRISPSQSESRRLA